MAQYHYRAEKLKPLVEAAGFTAEQLNLIHRMMGSCSQLRQRKVITSFLECMLPENMHIVTDRETTITTSRGFSFNPQYVLEKGQEIPRRKPDPDVAVCQICKTNPPDRIAFSKAICASCAGEKGEDDE